MLNRVLLIGRLVANIDLRKSSDGTPFAYFTLAVNRQSASDKTDFVSCVAWRGLAETMARFLVKGSLISVDGRLEVYRFEKNGAFETRTNVNVTNVDFLDRRNNPTQDQPNSVSTTTEDSINFDSPNPFATPNTNKTTQSNNINDDDLNSIEF